MAIVTETPVEGGGSGASSYDTAITTGGASSKIAALIVCDTDTTITPTLDPTGANTAPTGDILATTFDATDTGFGVRGSYWDGVGSGSQTIRATLGATAEAWVFLFSMTGAATGAPEDTTDIYNTDPSSTGATVALPSALTITDNSYQIAVSWSGSGITVSSVSTGLALVALTSSNKRVAHSTPASQSAGSQAATFTWSSAFGGKGVLATSFAEAGGGGGGATVGALVGGGLVNNGLIGSRLVNQAVERVGNLFVPSRKIIRPRLLMPVGVQLVGA